MSNQTVPPKKQKSVAVNQGGIAWAVRRGKLVVRLMADSRVPKRWKLLPIAALVYWIVPFDLAPLNPIDDITIFLTACEIFIALAPDDVVKEIEDALKAASGGSEETQGQSDYVDTDYRDVTPPGNEQHEGSGDHASDDQPYDWSQHA